MYFEKKRAFATGIAVCGSGLGTFLMAPLVHGLINWYGWEKAFVITGAIVLLCVILGALFRWVWYLAVTYSLSESPIHSGSVTVFLEDAITGIYGSIVT